MERGAPVAAEVPSMRARRIRQHHVKALAGFQHQVQRLRQLPMAQQPLAMSEGLLLPSGKRERAAALGTIFHLHLDRLEHLARRVAREIASTWADGAGERVAHQRGHDPAELLRVLHVAAGDERDAPCDRFLSTLFTLRN